MRYITEYELPLRYKADPRQTVLKYLDTGVRLRQRADARAAQKAVTAAAGKSRLQHMKARNLRKTTREDYLRRIAANKNVINTGSAETTRGLRELAAFIGGSKQHEK